MGDTPSRILVANQPGNSMTCRGVGDSGFAQSPAEHHQASLGDVRLFLRPLIADLLLQNQMAEQAIVSSRGSVSAASFSIRKSVTDKRL
jgi:hypothetical protein